MTGARGHGHWRAAAVTLLALAGGPAAADDPAAAIGIAAGPALPANDFQDAIGIGVHWTQRRRVFGPEDRNLVRALTTLGIRHVRGFDPVISEALARRGITSMLVAGPEVDAPDGIARMVLRANRDRQVVDAVEGPNEADLFWPLHHDSYEGQGFPAGTLRYQRALASSFRAQPRLRRVLLIGPSLGRTYDPPHDPNPLPPGSLASAVDLGNFHPYPFGGNSFSTPFPYDGIERYYWTGNFPSDNLDEYPYAFRVYAPPFAPRPMAATETGYATWRNGISETVQAVYIPRLVAEYCRLGIRRTYLYELVDDGGDSSGRRMEAHFGLLRADLTPKPAYVALQSLLALTRPLGGADDARDHPMLTLSARLPDGLDRARDVHSLTLRLGTGRAILLLWLEVASADTASTPPRAIAVPRGSVSVSAAAPWRITGWRDYGPDWRFRRHAARGDATVPLEDRIVAVSLERLSSSPRRP